MAAGRHCVPIILFHILQNSQVLKCNEGNLVLTTSAPLQAGTYNVNGRRPPADLDLTPWLNISEHSADIVAVGFQEVVPLNANNVVMGEFIHVVWTSPGMQLCLLTMLPLPLRCLTLVHAAIR